MNIAKETHLSPTFQWQPRWQQLRAKFPVLTLLVMAIAAVLLLPLVYLVVRAVGAGTDGIEYLLRERTLRIISNSLVLVVSVSLSAGALGVVFAWLTSATDLPFRRVILVLGLLPMVIPSYVAAVTFLDVFGPVGLMRDWLGLTRMPSVYGFFGAWLLITLLTYPYVAMPVRAALLNRDRALEEAARSMGLNGWAVFRRVTLPQLRPALAAGMMMTALYTLSDFGVVMILRYNAFTRAIYLSYENSFNTSRAAVLALALVAMMLVFLAVERWVAAGNRHYRVGTGVSRRASVRRLGAWTLPALLFVGVLITVGVLLPVATLFKWALNPNVTSAVQVDFTQLSLNTVWVSVLAALSAGLLALPLASFAVRHTNGWARALVSSAYVGNTLPGIVVGLALVFVVMRGAPSLYQTLPILIMGYVIRFLPFTLGSTRSALTQINPSLSEAARSLGSTPLKVTLRVVLPMASSGILAGLVLVFLNTMKELPTTLILAPIGFRTLASRIWTASDAGSYGLIGLPGLVLIGVSCLSLVLILWREKRPTT